MKLTLKPDWKSLFLCGGAAFLLGCVDSHNKTIAQTPVVSAPVPATTVATAPAQGVETIDVAGAEATPQPQNLTQAPSTNTVAGSTNAPGENPLPEVRVSPRVGELVKLVQGGVNEEILLAYIENASYAFNPTADEVMYLSDLGVSEKVITALLSHKGNPAGKTNAVHVAVSTNAPVPPPVYSTPAPAPEQPASSTTTTYVYEQPQQQVTTTVFYETLAPYGAWVDVPGYGPCWQPTVAVVNPGWRPYYDRGRWVYTDAGWYWHSDYSWGWAAFHYGRWHSSAHHGWVWVPGTVWGPSWVSWRYSRGYCGWAPLPPEAHFQPGVGFYYRNSRVGVGFDFGLGVHAYTFIPEREVCSRTPSRHYVDRTHATTIYKDSTVINNYIVGNNNTIINEGIGRDRVAAAAGREIKKVPIRDVSTAGVAAPRAERLDRDGKTLLVYKPGPEQLQRPASAAAQGGRPGAQRAGFTRGAAPATHGAEQLAGRPGRNHAVEENATAGRPGAHNPTSIRSGFANAPQPVRPNASGTAQQAGSDVNAGGARPGGAHGVVADNGQNAGRPGSVTQRPYRTVNEKAFEAGEAGKGNAAAQARPQLHGGVRGQGRTAAVAENSAAAEPVFKGPSTVAQPNAGTPFRGNAQPAQAQPAPAPTYGGGGAHNPRPSYSNPVGNRGVVSSGPAQPSVPMPGALPPQARVEAPRPQAVPTAPAYRPPAAVDQTPRFGSSQQMGRPEVRSAPAPVMRSEPVQRPQPSQNYSAPAPRAAAPSYSAPAPRAAAPSTPPPSARPSGQDQQRPPGFRL